MYCFIVPLLLHSPAHLIFFFFNRYYIITSEENNWRICSPFNLPLPCNKRVVRDWARKNKEDIVAAGKSYSNS